MSPGRACRPCDAGEDHCHGVLIVHEDGCLECTSAGCVELSLVRHELVLCCPDPALTCGCVG
jgi:hypothetical protein